MPFSLLYNKHGMYRVQYYAVKCTLVFFPLNKEKKTSPKIISKHSLKSFLGRCSDAKWANIRFLVARARIFVYNTHCVYTFYGDNIFALLYTLSALCYATVSFPIPNISIKIPCISSYFLSQLNQMHTLKKTCINVHVMYVYVYECVALRVYWQNSRLDLRVFIFMPPDRIWRLFKYSLSLYLFKNWQLVYGI